jgi:nucleotide-binding universal stress UspA family protein
MNVKFSTILVPVDFTVNTEVAIKKALALCENPEATIHLLHIPKISVTNVVNFYQNYPWHSSKAEDSTIIEAEKQMEKLKNYILVIKRDINVITWVSYENSVESAIINKAKAIQADLVVIGKNSHHSWLPFLNTVVPVRVAKKTGMAVLTVKPGAINHQIKTVVIPISNKIPERKIATIDALRKKFRIHICLVTFLDNGDDPEILPSSLLNAYRYLKTGSMSNVDFEVLKGNNRAKSILNYCKKVNADLLIVNPESETRIGWLNKHISDVLPVQSKTQILAV